MAFLQKKKDVYYLCEKVKKQNKWAVKWVKLGRIPYPKAKAALIRYEADKTYLRLGIESGHDITLQSLFDLYKEYQLATPTKKLKTFNKECSLLNVFMREFGHVNIERIDCELVNKWFVQKKYQPNTIRLYIEALRQLYNLALKRGYIKSTPISGIYRPKIIPKPPRYASPELIEIVFNELHPSARPLFEIMLYAGLRPIEALRLRVENIKLKSETLDLYPEQTKTANRGLIPIHPKLIPIFKKLLVGKKADDHLFAGLGKMPHQVEYKNALSRACARASKKLGEKIKLTAYQLRHTFATRILEKTGDLRVTQQLLRHANISMTTRYATALEPALRKAIESI